MKEGEGGGNEEETEVRVKRGLPILLIPVRI